MFKNLKDRLMGRSDNESSRPVIQILERDRKRIEEELNQCTCPSAETESHQQLFIPDKPVTVIIVGAGSRGKVYADYAKLNPEMMKVVAVVDMSESRCKLIQEEHIILPENVFIGDWTLIVNLPKLADAVCICTPDKCHVDPAIAFCKLKYHILLEKPMSNKLEDCRRICEAVLENRVVLVVAHILRYSMYIRCLKKIIDSGVLGEIVNIQHVEMINYWHFAHSYVRGNWRKEETSSFSLLTKCCHDLDLIPYLMKKKCIKISSFGNLKHFKKENKPIEAGEAKTCLECTLMDKCPYSAKKIYIDKFTKYSHQGWPLSVVQPDGIIDIENLTAALQEKDYGRCVYEMDNDVCDHQVVNMEFDGGATASHTMMAFTNAMIRKIRIFGTMGELEGDGHDKINVTDFRTGKTHQHTALFEMVESGRFQMSGHGGGDFALAKQFVMAVASGDHSKITTGPTETLESHMYVFAAEESRRSGRTIDMQEFKMRNGFE